MSEKIKNWQKDIFYILLGLLLGEVFFVFNILGFNLAYFPGDLGDGRLNLYFLEHAYQFFSGHLSEYWNAPFMYPEHNMISYSDNLLGSAPLYFLFRFVGFDIYASYQWWFIIVSSLNYIFAYYFLKYLLKNRQVAVLGAFIFAFSIALQSQLTHAQTFPRFAIPLAFLMATKFREQLEPKYFFYTLLAVVYQIYCGIYLGFMLAVPVGIYLVLIGKEVVQSKKKKFEWKWYFGAIVLNILILLPLMWPYIERKASPSINHFFQIAHSIPTLKSYFFVQKGSLFWDILSKTALEYKAWWDHQIFTGGVATVAFIVAVYWTIKTWRKANWKITKLTTTHLFLLVGFITFLFYLRFWNFSAYIFLYFLPGFNAMRSMTRIINIELLFFAMATAFVFLKIFKHNQKYQMVLFLGVLFFLVADNYFYGKKSYRTRVDIAKQRTDKLDNIFSKIPKNALVSYEPEKKNINPVHCQIDAMLLAQKYGLKTVNGYTATCPGDYSRFWNQLDEEGRNVWLATKEIPYDTLYVVQDSNKIKKITMDEVRSFKSKHLKEMELQHLIDYIKTDNKWLENVKQKAKERGISLDSMLYLDAQWVMEHKKK